MKKSLKPSTSACPAPTWCVGTYDAEGKPNVMTIAWGGICCSVPPCLSVSLRSATYSHAAMMARKCWTVSIPSVKYLKEADYFGMVSGKKVDKFAVSGLTATRSDVVDAPYVEEFPLIFECRLKEAVEVGGHTLFVGEIAGIKADEEVLNDKDMPLLEKVNPFVFAPTTREYRAIAEVIGNGFSSGKEVG